MEALEIVLTNLVKHLYGDAVSTLSSFRLCDLLGYTTIAGSILTLAFISPISSARLDERSQAEHRMSLNLLKYIPFAAAPMFLAALLLLFASTVNLLLMKVLYNLSFIVIVFTTIWILYVFIRFFLAIVIIRLLEATKYPSGGL